MENKINIPIGMSGRFTKIEILSGSGEVKRTIEGFDNLITDIGLDQLASRVPVGAYNVCGVGSGQGVPDTSSTAPFGFVASTTTASTKLKNVLAEGYCAAVVTYTFALGAIKNQNITNICTGWGASVGMESSIFSIALIKDSEGNPTTITVLEDEQLRVTWEHRRYWPSEDVVGSIANEGNKGGTYGYIVRPANLASWECGSHGSGTIAATTSFGNTGMTNSIFYAPSTLGPQTGVPAGVRQPVGSAVNGAGHRLVTANLSWVIGEGNAPTGISALLVGCGASWTQGGAMLFQVELSPPIMKTAEDTLALSFEFTWGRR